MEAERYRFFPNQVMTEVKEHPTYNNGAICCMCKINPVSKCVRWINSFWTGQYNFRYVCDNPECIKKAKQDFVKEW